MSGKISDLGTQRFFVLNEEKSKAKKTSTLKKRFKKGKACEVTFANGLVIVKQGGSLKYEIKVTNSDGSHEAAIEYEGGSSFSMGVGERVLGFSVDSSGIKNKKDAIDIAARWVRALVQFQRKNKRKRFEVEELRKMVLGMNTHNEMNMENMQSPPEPQPPSSTNLLKGSDGALTLRHDGLASFLAQAAPTYVDDVDEETRTNYNELFQRQVPVLMSFDPANPDASRIPEIEKLINVAEDFLKNAGRYGRIIISEVFLPEAEKTIKPASLGGVIGGQKYVVAGILFKFATDAEGVFGGNHGSAAKVAGLELHGFQAYFSTLTNGLNYPLQALIDFKGFRVIASTLLPLYKGSIVYGSDDAATTIHRKDESMNNRMQSASAKLNLKPHKCGDGDGVLMYSCVDIEGHHGKDGRFYVLDFSRTMPPVTPNRKVVNGHLFQLFRGEFIKRYRKPLSSDAFSRFTMLQPDFKENNSEVAQATKFLLFEEIPKFAKEFVHIFEEETCGENETENLRRFNLSQRMHAAGVNMRYLGYLTMWVMGVGEEMLDPKEDATSEKKETAVGFLDFLEDDQLRIYGKKGVKGDIEDNLITPTRLLLMEMVSRVCKLLLRTQLREAMEQRRVPRDEPFIEDTITFLNKVFGNSVESATFWKDTIEPELELKFDFPLSQLFPAGLKRELCKENSLRFLLWSRVQEMLGIVFAPTIASVLSEDVRVFETSEVFERADIVELGERVKNLDVLSTAKGYITYLRAVERISDGHFVAARELFLQSMQHYSDGLSASPDNVKIHLAMAKLCIKLAYLNHVIRNNLKSMGGLNLDKEWPYTKKAHSHFLQAIKLSVGLTLSRTKGEYAHFFLEQTEQFAEAEDYYLQSLKIHPSNHICLMWYGQFLQVHFDSMTAEPFLNKAQDIKAKIFAARQAAAQRAKENLIVDKSKSEPKKAEDEDDPATEANAFADLPRQRSGAVVPKSEGSSTVVPVPLPVPGSEKELKKPTTPLVLSAGSTENSWEGLL